MWLWDILVLGTFRPWDHESLGCCNLGTLRPLDPGTLGILDFLTFSLHHLLILSLTSSYLFLLPLPSTSYYLLLHSPTSSYPTSSGFGLVLYDLVWFGRVWGRGREDVRWLVSSYVKRFQCYSTQKSFMVVVGDIAEIWNRPGDSWLLEFIWTRAWQQQDNCVCDSTFWTWVVNFWTSFIVTKM